jgi:hypothetical protein
MITGRVRIHWLGLDFLLPMDRAKEAVESWEEWDDLDMLVFLCEVGRESDDVANTDLTTLFREHYDITPKPKPPRTGVKKR